MSQPKKLTIDQLDALLALDVPLEILPDGRARVRVDQIPPRRLVLLTETAAVNPADVIAIDVPADGRDWPKTPVRVRLKGGIHYRVAGTVASVAAALGLAVDVGAVKENRDGGNQ